MMTESSDSNNAKFLCGVVEGFYGRPWSLDQRKELYNRMNSMGMNAYVYAPKDDLKHRADWRSLYSPDEADHLRNLISTCEQQNVTFVYALSPGIDMVYSSTKEQQAVYHKLLQVKNLGCTAFALLFDDIEPCMCDIDKKHYASFAYAQVAVTNATYEDLGSPALFLFCPTEYCESRAVPTLEKSEYLNVLGKKLIKDIHILWTGARVISRRITENHVQRVAKVICRKPLIWDNLHANDYDSRRIFLVSAKDFARDAILEAGSEQIVADEIKRRGAPQKIYHPAQCLDEALRKWLPHINGTTTRNLPNFPKSTEMTVPGINTCGVLTSTTTTCASACNPAFMTQLSSDPTPQPIYSPAPSVFSGTSQDGTTLTGNEDPLLTAAMVAVNSLSHNYCDKSEPMELTNNANIHKETSFDSSIPMEESVEDLSKLMQIDEGVDLKEEQWIELSCGELRDIADLFHLPFEHGNRGNWLIAEFAWLTENAPSVSIANRKGNEAATKEWRNRATEFVEFSTRFTEIYLKMFFCKNRQFIHDLYPYVWDVRDTISLLSCYIMWLRENDEEIENIEIPIDCEPIVLRSMSALEPEQNGIMNEQNCNNDKFRCPTDGETSPCFQDPEPWVFRGGLVGEMLDEIYALSLKTFDDLKDVTAKFSECPQIVGERNVGAFLSFCPRDCFVVEEIEFDWSTNRKQTKIVGFAAAAFQAQTFLKYCSEEYYPNCKEKFVNNIESTSTQENQAIEAGLNCMHELCSSVGCNVFVCHESLLYMRVLQCCIDSSEIHRLTALILAALKSRGSSGAFCCVNENDRSLLEMYSKVGFFDFSAQSQNHNSKCVLLVRKF